MQTTFNYEGKNLFTPTIFLPEFNSFAPISATQAWSLFFTVSHDDTSLGSSTETGKFWTSLVLAAVATGILGVFIFQNM